MSVRLYPCTSSVLFMLVAVCCTGVSAAGIGGGGVGPGPGITPGMSVAIHPFTSLA